MVDFFPNRTTFKPWSVLFATGAGLLLLHCPAIDHRTLHEGVAGSSDIGSASGAPGDEMPSEEGISGAPSETFAGAGGTDAVGGTGGVGGAGGESDLGTGTTGCGDFDENEVPDCWETIAENPGFHFNIDFWDAEQTVTERWVPKNFNGGDKSGALSVLNDYVADAGTSFALGTHQCFAATGDTEYTVAAQVFVPSAQGEGNGAIVVDYYGASDCGGAFVASVLIATGTKTDTWEAIGGTFKSSFAAQSMQVRLVASKPYSSPWLEVIFDNVLVKPGP